MKKTRLLLIIIFVSAIGVVLSQLTSSAFRSPGFISLLGDDIVSGEAPLRWMTYTADAGFSLRYPENWVFNPGLYGVMPPKNEWQFVSVGEKQPNGAVNSYQFIITRYENPQKLGCQPWLQEDMERQIQETVAGGGISRTDAEELFRVRYEPVTKEIFPNYEACKMPAGRGEDVSTRYYISWGERIYSISFPRAGLPSDQALNATENAAIAVEMMKSLRFVNP